MYEQHIIQDSRVLCLIFYTKKENDPVKSLPKNLDLFSLSFPLTAIVSILHRVFGVFLLLSLPIFIWLLGISFTSSGFSWLQAELSQAWVKFFVWGILSSLIYHWVAGVRHLFMDFSIGISRSGGKIGARLVLIFSVLLMICLGVYLW